MRTLASFLKLISLMVILSGILAGVIVFEHHSEAVFEWIKCLGILAPIFFLGLYCLATLLFLPTIVLTLAGGALFGLIPGLLLNLIGATFGAGCAFYISRYFFTELFLQRKNKQITKLMAGVEARGWRFVALLRLIPLVPFNFVNYGLGLTKIKFSHYLLTTFICMIPAEMISTYCGFASTRFFLNPTEWQKYWHLLVVCSAILLFLLLKIASVLCANNLKNLPAHRVNVSHQVNSPNVVLHPKKNSERHPT